ncbi:unnamed protein product [Polarella glacialis]|uniref:Uncharacterized protein n=1 Tax=Polarella glacialis TaxID=89957 RepID=A0A813JGN8_POLGL|nr:unnamed protein product [Polarella glacialis]
MTLASERGHKALQQQTVRDPKYNNNNKNNNNYNKKNNYLYLAATRFMTSLKCLGCLARFQSLDNGHEVEFKPRAGPCEPAELSKCRTVVDKLKLGFDHYNINKTSTRNQKAQQQSRETRSV